MLSSEIRKSNLNDEFLDRLNEIGLEDNPFVWTQKISAKCRPEIDLKKRRMVDDMLGIVLRDVEQIRNALGHNDSQSEKELDIIRGPLGELYENQRVKRVLAKLSRESMLEYLDEAELLCAAMLDVSE